MAEVSKLRANINGVFETFDIKDATVRENVEQANNAIDALKITDTASGAIASFPDGAAMPMESLTVDLEPIQDLHGQDAPYPAGGGVNKFDKDAAVVGKWLDVNTGVERNTSTNYALSDWIPVRSGMTYAFTNPRSSRCWAYDVSKNPLAAISNPYTATADGYIRITVTIVDVSLDTFMVVEGSTLPSTYAPYSNICPITGRNSVTVTRTGKNILDITHSFDISTGTLKGTEINLSAGTRVYVARRGGVNSILYGRKKDGTYLEMLTITENVKTSSLSQDLTAIGISTGAAESYGADDICIVSLEPFTDFVPYDGQSATIQLGTTVYGGTVDVTTGVMTVDRAIVDLGTLDWIIRNFGTQSGFASYELPGGKSIPGNTGIMEQAVCSIYKIGTNGSLSVASNDIIAAVGAYYASGCNIYVRDSRFTDVATFKTAMQGEQLVYELATPLEITLDPATLSTLKGTNNVWSDADSVSVEYVADPKLYIARLTDPDADMVADTNITSGKYFMVGNSLYLATSNIASGASIVPGVNCTKTNLSAALNAINA